MPPSRYSCQNNHDHLTWYIALIISSLFRSQGDETKKPAIDKSEIARSLPFLFSLSLSLDPATLSGWSYWCCLAWALTSIYFSSNMWQLCRCLIIISNNKYMCKKNNHSNLQKCTTGDNKWWRGGASCSLRWSRGTLACLVTDKDRTYSLMIDENNVILCYTMIDNGHI